MDGVLKFLDWFLEKYEKLVKTYPRLTRTIEWTAGALLVGLLLYTAFAFYVLNMPRLTVHKYFAALNKKRWEEASQLLAPELAVKMNSQRIEQDYSGFAGHENVSTSLAPDQNAADVFLNDRIKYNVKYEFHVTITKADLNAPGRHGDVLWAEIAFPEKLHDLKNNPDAAPIHLRTEQVNGCTLQKYDGKWRILDYWERVSDTLKFKD